MSKSSLAAINRESAKSNRGPTPKAGMTQPAGGSSAIHDPGPKGKGKGMGGASDTKALGRLSAGRPDTAKGKNVS